MDNTLVLPVNIEFHDNCFWTSSKDVAEKFGKSHKFVLRKIREVIKDLPSDFSRVHFCTYDEVKERKLPSGSVVPLRETEYELSEEAFAFVAMSFTGRKATKWKVEYIKAFTKMRVFILEAYRKGKEDAETKSKLPGPRTGMIPAPVYGQTLYDHNDILKWEWRSKAQLDEMTKLKAHQRHLRKQVKGMSAKMDQLAELMEAPKLRSREKEEEDDDELEN